MPPEFDQSHIRPFLEAWERLSDKKEPGDGPKVLEHPGLIDCLFLLAHDPEGRLIFRKVAPGVERLFGRELVGHEFMGLWRREHATEITESTRRALKSDRPLKLSARSVTLDGTPASLALALAPIQSREGREARFLGLCQRLSTKNIRPDRPVGPLSLEHITQTTAAKPARHLRLVVSNT